VKKWTYIVKDGKGWYELVQNIKTEKESQCEQQQQQQQKKNYPQFK
jgi:hypothetical protein